MYYGVLFLLQEQIFILCKTFLRYLVVTVMMPFSKIYSSYFVFSPKSRCFLKVI